MDIHKRNFFQHDRVVDSLVCVPIMDHDSPNGCVYLMDYDAEQGNIIANLERTILQGSFVLLGAIILFSAFFATTSSRRMRKILTSMRMVREGEYSHKIQMRGSDEFATLATEFNKLTDLKLFTAIIVAIFLAVPHLQAQAKSSFAHVKKQGKGRG